MKEYSARQKPAAKWSVCARDLQVPSSPATKGSDPRFPRRPALSEPSARITARFGKHLTSYCAFLTLFRSSLPALASPRHRPRAVTLSAALAPWSSCLQREGAKAVRDAPSLKSSAKRMLISGHRRDEGWRASELHHETNADTVALSSPAPNGPWSSNGGGARCCRSSKSKIDVGARTAVFGSPFAPCT